MICDKDAIKSVDSLFRFMRICNESDDVSADCTIRANFVHEKTLKRTISRAQYMLQIAYKEWRTRHVKSTGAPIFTREKLSTHAW